jgi:hypothetical protein
MQILDQQHAKEKSNGAKFLRFKNVYMPTCSKNKSLPHRVCSAKRWVMADAHQKAAGKQKTRNPEALIVSALVHESQPPGLAFIQLNSIRLWSEQRSDLQQSNKKNTERYFSFVFLVDTTPRDALTSYPFPSCRKIGNSFELLGEAVPRNPEMLTPSKLLTSIPRVK